MWLFSTKGFASVVEKDDNPAILLCRSRFKGDLERMFPEAKGKVQTTPNKDYLYRVELPGTVVAAAISKLVDAIDYPNFKNAVPQKARQTIYSRVWGIMFNAQDIVRSKAAHTKAYNRLFPTRGERF